MLRVLVSLALTVFVGAAFAAPPSSPGEVKVHTIAMKVVVDGQVVMTPNVRTVEGAVGTLSVAGESGGPGYTLEFEVGTQLRGSVEATTLKGSLYRTTGQRRELLAAPDLAFRAGGTPTMKIGSDGPHGVSIEVSSHAIALENRAALSMKSCEASGQAESLNAAMSDCCSARCLDGTPNVLTCCGVISCCGCGACCVVP